MPYRLPSRRCFVFLGLVSGIVLAPLSRADIRATIEPGITSLSLHEPVTIQVTLWNTGSAPIELKAGQALEQDVVVQVTTPAGVTERISAPSWARGPEVFAALSIETVPPSAAYKQVLLLNDWYDFPQPGQYSVQLTIPGVASPVLTAVRVEPRDPTRLEAICANLMRDSLDPYSPRRLEASRTLASVEDEVAVPFLIRLAASKLDYRRGMEGLAHVGSENAVAVLADIMRSGIGDAAAYARFHLVRLKDSAKTEAVRHAIDAALTTP